MKGVLKGFKYISSIFEEEEEGDDDEIQIGLPTDVKHVAHIGTDGPSKESPSWMKDFSAERPKSAPLDSNGKPLDLAGDKTSTDTELPKTSRRRHSADSLAFDNPDRVLAKSKGIRRHHKKNSDGSVGKSSRSRHRRKDSSSDPEGSSKSRHVTRDLKSNGDITELPDIPKKSRRKKVKDEISKIATKAKPKIGSDGADVPPSPSHAGATLPPAAPTTTDNTSCPFSDPGSVGTDSTTTITCDGESCRIVTKPSPPKTEEEKNITTKPSPPKIEEEKTDKSDGVGCLENSA